MKRQVMDIRDGGRRFVCIFDGDADRNKYRLYEITMRPSECGWRDSRKQLVRYANFESVIYHLEEMVRAGQMPTWKRDVFPGVK